VVFGEATGSREISLASPLAPNSLTFSNVSTSDPYIITGAPITGFGDLFKRGSGEVQLNSANSFLGAIYISGGTLTTGDLEALGTRDAIARLEISNGAELHVTSSATTERRLRTGIGGGTIRVDDGFTLVKIGVSDLIDTLTKAGGGTLQFNGYSGSTSVAATDFIVNEGTLEFTAATGYFNSRPFGGTQFDGLNITVNTGGTVRMSVDSALGGDYLAFQTSLNQIRLLGGTLDVNNGGFNYIHNGTVGAEGRVVLQGGTITGPGQLEPAANTGNTATTLFTVLPSAQSSYIGGSGQLALNPADSSLTLDVADGSAEDDLVIQRTISGSRPLTKSGAGNLVLTSTNNSFNGAFTVSAGSLTLANSGGNATGTSAVTMAAGTTLRGHGFANGGSITTAGTIAPGDATTTTGTLTTGTTALTGTLEIDIESDIADKLQVNGTLDITGATLNVTGTPTEPLYQIVSSAGPITGTFATTNIPAGYTLQYHQNSIVLLSDTAPAYEVWASGLSNPSQDADLEGDGLVNVLEFILNSNATVSSTADLPDVTTNPAGDLIFTFVRKSSSAYLGAVVEYSTALSEGSWTTFGGATVQSNTPSAGLDTVTATLPASLAAPDGRIFARLKVDVP
jgi:autotransporter-associated beta strand protein